jgi:hypothetical protein
MEIVAARRSTRTRITAFFRLSHRKYQEHSRGPLVLDQPPRRDQACLFQACTVPDRLCARAAMPPATPTPSTYIQPSWKSNKWELSSELMKF